MREEGGVVGAEKLPAGSLRAEWDGIAGLEEFGDVGTEDGRVGRGVCAHEEFPLSLPAGGRDFIDGADVRGLAGENLEEHRLIAGFPAGHVDDVRGVEEVLSQVAGVERRIRVAAGDEDVVDSFGVGRP